jgi:glycosyltransferase involved in cell wall biosynthesis
MKAVLVDLLCSTPSYCGELAMALRESGLDAELASPRFYLEPRFLDAYPRSSWIRDLTVHAARPRPLRLAVRAVEGSLNYARLLARIRAKSYDVVHVQWIPLEDRASPFMPILRSLCDDAGTLLVLTVHNAVPHDRVQVDLAVLKRNLDCAHLIVALTEHVAFELSRDVGTVSPIVVIPLSALFVNHDLPPRGEAIARLGDPTGPIVLFLGLIRPYKGLDLLSEAWQEVRNSFPDATLFVVGKVLDDASGLELRRLHGHEGVRFIDHYVPVSEMLDYYAVADTVVFPYRRISQSGALMTAAGLGRPTVVTPIAGFLEQVGHLRSAVVADEVSGAAIARALIYSLERREELAVAAEHDRAAIAGSPIGWASVARATVRAYETNLRILRRQD